MNSYTNSAVRLLIVDDDVGQADMLMEFLHIAGFIHVDLVESTRDLWRKLTEMENAYDIILLDYMLQDGTGLDVLRELPERGCHIPVIMVTGHGSERVAAQAIQNGAIDYLIKTGNYLLTIPALIKKTLEAQELKLTAQRSLQALKESEARYRAIVEDYQTELICRFQPNGALTFVNEVFCQFFNRPREELIGMNILFFVPEDERPRIIQHLAALNTEKPVATLEHQVKVNDHETHWIQRTDRAILDSQGQIFELQSMARDITARKSMENQLQAAQAHLVQAARLVTIGEMAAGVAHQIYNPLTTIIADAQILLRNLPAEGVARESAQAIEQAGWRLQEVVQRLMEFSRPSNETPTSIQINETIQKALSLVQAHLEEVGCRIETQLEEGLPVISGNPRQLTNLWVYLLLLARDAFRDGQGSCIYIQSRTGPGNFVMVELSDDGIPIPEEMLPRVFEPDFVGSTGGRGSGMELSICREIVRQHGGQITADSNSRKVSINNNLSPVHDTISVDNLRTVKETVFRVAIPAVA